MSIEQAYHRQAGLANQQQPLPREYDITGIQAKYNQFNGNNGYLQPWTPTNGSAIHSQSNVVPTQGINNQTLPDSIFINEQVNQLPSAMQA